MVKVYIALYLFVTIKTTAEKGPRWKVLKKQRVRFVIESIPFYEKILKNKAILYHVTLFLLGTENIYKCL